MGVISTTTVLESLRYPSDSMIDRTANGRLWFLKRSSSTTWDLWYSTNNGTTWTVDPAPAITRANLIETSGIFIDAQNTIHMMYRVYESGEDRVYYRRKEETDTAWEAERLVISATAASAGAVYTGMSVIAYRLNSVNYVFFAVGLRYAAQSGVTILGSTINSSGVWTLKNTLIDGVRQWINGPDGVVHPALDFKHSGDGKNVGSGPAIWCTWGRSTVYCIKASWTSGPNWYGPWTPTTVATGPTNQDYNVGRYNGYGDKFHVAYPNGLAVSVAERKVDDSGGVTRTTPNHPQGTVTQVGLSNNSLNNNYRVFAVGTTTPDLYFVDWSSGVWGAWTLVTGTDVVGAAPNNFSIRRNNYGNGQFDLVLAGGTSPYTLTHTSSTSATAPKTPVILSPSNGSAQDVAQPLVLSWTFTDDDPLDSQQTYALRRNIGGVIRYWNNGTATWQVGEVFNASGTTGKTFAGGWGADADAPHYYAVKVQDQATLTSGYSADIQVVPTAIANPTITAPGASVTTPTITATWTVANQSAYRVELLVSGTAVYDSGWVSSTALSQPIPYQLTNAGSYTVRVTTRNAEGLQGTAQTQAFTVTFTPPHAPTSVTLTPSVEDGGMYVTIANGTPSGGEPAFSSQTLYRRLVGNTDSGVRVASGLANNATYFDFTVIGGIDYEYRFDIAGTNGATRLTSWYS